MTIGADHELCVSFVHGFHDHVNVNDRLPRPALWTINAQAERTFSYCFPIDPVDFDSLPYPVIGEAPRTMTGASRRPRYGFAGLVRVNDYLLAGSWNGIYKLDATTKQVHSFITNRYSCYIHRFCANAQRIIFAMPFMDMVVIMDHAGQVIDRFTIDQSLNISRDLADPNIDWRFVEKPWSGPTGLFHFNSVQTIGDDLLLLSRNLGAFVVVQPGADHASLRTLNYWTPTCVHDGDFINGKFYLTSIDGKILIASEPTGYDPKLFHYDLQVKCFRLHEVENNWCRGIAVTDDYIYTTIDGRYDTDLSFALLQHGHDGKLLDQRRFHWANVGKEKDIRYVTGFDIVTNP